MASEPQIAPFIYHAREFAPARGVRVWDAAGLRLAFALWHVRHGTVTVRRDDRRVCHLRPGACGVTGPGTTARLGVDSQGSLLVFDIAARWRARWRDQDGIYQLRDSDAVQPEWRRCFATPLPLPVDPAWHHETILLCDHLRHNYWRSASAHRECNARLHHWLARYARFQAVAEERQLSPDLAEERQLSPDLAQRVEAIIHESSHARLTVTELARLVGASPSSVHRAYVARFGHGPRRGLELRRMDAAMRYLRQDDMSIEAIAHAIGYTDHASFTRAFRRCTGSTPRAWRRAR
ncbi:MAG: helix-turn-helix domain-containing protein [Planctomycetota bacterium]